MIMKHYDFTQYKCWFDPEGNLYIPINIKIGGDISPKLKPREWWYMILTYAQNVPKDKEKSLWKHLIGSVATKHRVKKSLIKKGYL